MLDCGMVIPPDRAELTRKRMWVKLVTRCPNHRCGFWCTQALQNNKDDLMELFRQSHLEKCAHGVKMSLKEKTLKKCTGVATRLQNVQTNPQFTMSKNQIVKSQKENNQRKNNIDIKRWPCKRYSDCSNVSVFFTQNSMCAKKPSEQRSKNESSTLQNRKSENTQLCCFPQKLQHHRKLYQNLRSKTWC